MKITLNREQLAKVSTLASLAIESRPTVPVWECLYFNSKGGKLYIYGRGESSQIRVFQQIEHTEDFDFLIPAKIFIETIKNIKTELIEIVVERNKSGDTIHINAVGRKSKFSIASHNPKVYSVDIAEDETHSFETSAREFLTVLKSCSLFPNEKDMRLSLQGISMRNFENRVEIVGTNGYSIARYLLDIDAEISPIVMQKNISAALAVFPEEGNLIVRTTNKSVVMDNGSIQIISRTIDTKFPDVNQFWVNEFVEDKYVTVQKADIQEMTKLMRNFSQNEHSFVKISVNGNEIVFSTNNGDKSNAAEHSVSAENFNTEEVYVALNITFLEKVVNNISTDSFNLYIKAPNKGVFVTENNSLNKSFIIQPVQI